MATRQRLGELNRAVLEVLESQGPLPKAEVVTRVRELVPPTPDEARPQRAGRPGVDRYTNRLGWSTTGMAAIGLMRKARSGWEITDSGRRMLAEVTDPGDFQGEVERRYKEHLHHQRGAVATAERRELLERALSVVDAGTWTSYSDLAQLVGMTPVSVGTWLSSTELENGYRVLTVDGSVSADFRWAGEDRGSPLNLLRDEGVQFDRHHRASPQQRLTTVDLREALELGDSTQRRGWLVRGANVHGRNLLPDWFESGYCSIAAPELDEIPGGLNRQEIAAVVAEQFGDASPGRQALITSTLHAFLTAMSVGDVVVTVDEDQVYVGKVTGEPEYVDSPGRLSSRRRPVAWANPDRPLSRAGLPASAQNKLRGQRTVSQLGAELGHFTRPLGLEDDHAAPPPPLPEELRLRPATDELAGALLLDRGWLQETIDLLEDRKQLVFYGPPGTGKTFVAQALAEHLAGRDRVKLVQFHPSYSYEDFIEGIRPRLGDGGGTIGYELVPGPFRRLVEQAEADPGHPYVLVIDEINRANLAKVFGELYFLLEYRRATIELLYSGDDDFNLPENVFVIGTMNTADRSIALVDAAMRRRFAFQAFFPDRPPVSGLLRRWLQRRRMWSRPADLLDQLNRSIDDPDAAIGPSYLMTARASTEEGLERIWRTSILPLLDEHFFGEKRDVAAEFGIAALSSRQATPPESPDQ